MDFLVEFDKCAFQFWQAWTALPSADKQRLSGTHVYHQLFQTAFNIKRTLQDPLMTGPPHCKTYTPQNLASHVIQCSDSDDGCQ